MKAEEFNRIFDQCVADYHHTDNVDAPEQKPFTESSFQSLLYHKAWIDTVQWHLEDIVRNPEIDPVEALKVKRRIDKSNQDRTDRVEQIDDYFLQQFNDITPAEDARINTESPAWAIDRLSILALKIYHMQIEASRNDISSELLEKNLQKLTVLLTQRKDLTLAINQLLEDISHGKRIMKVYRQMKMYNDPELNPVLYTAKNS